MELVIKKYQELTSDELYEILKVRAEVFVVEQHCVYQDMDNLDQCAVHIYLRDDNGIQEPFFFHFVSILSTPFCFS